MQDGVRAVGQMVALKAQLNAEIAQARARFWKAYPNGPDFERARARFARALLDKDQFYLLSEVTALGSREASATFSIGGEIDGGISSILSATFSAWTMEVRKNIGAGGAKTWALLFQQGDAKAEIEKAHPLYVIYQVRRDLEEFRVKGIKPPGVDQGFWDRLQLAASMRQRGGLTSSVDPYSYAFEHSGDQADFGPACKDYLAKLAPRSKANACFCIRQVFLADGEPEDLARLDAKFNEQNFLLLPLCRDWECMKRWAHVFVSHVFVRLDEPPPGGRFDDAGTGSTAV